MEKPYLIELVRDMPPLGTKETTKRATTDISSRNIVVK